MDEHSDAAPVRLAEIVAALSLGIDLGFSQPMEHVLRQCLIALRLAELIGLDAEARAAVYYSALLVNVGCHSDAHEQAKWFGDDIGLKSVKYDHELGSARASACAGPTPKWLEESHVRAVHPDRVRSHRRRIEPDRK